MSNSVNSIPLRPVLGIVLAIDSAQLMMKQLMSWLQSGHHAISYVLPLNTDKAYLKLSPLLFTLYAKIIFPLLSSNISRPYSSLVHISISGSKILP